jgi:hypothetical protein
VPAAPVAPCAKGRKHTVVDHRFAGTPGLPCAMVLTAYFVLSPVTGSLATVIRGYDASHTRLGGCTSAKLDASVGASGPHDFTVRDMHRSSARRYRSRETALRSASRDDAATSIASPSRVRDDRDTPLASPKPARMSERAVLTKPPVAGTEPVTPQRR